MAGRIARAKINLALHVTGRRADGYHELDTLVGFAAIGDHVEIANGEPGSLAVTGPFAAQLQGMDAKDNLVARARDEAMRIARAGGRDVAAPSLRLVKNLPVASGIGGGSADAAATLRLLADHWGIADRDALLAAALRLGSDVPMCLASHPLRARGRGEFIEKVPRCLSLHALLVNPGVAVSTPAVFSALARRDHPGLGPFPADPFDPSCLRGLRNDLEEAAISISPVIGEALTLLRQLPGALMARMSGSGATCFALFDSAAQAGRGQDSLIDSQPGWWCAATTIEGSSGEEEPA
jgi:4-diphosphocytidyl-2-C-methyl-D-erythritol kinase